MLNFPNDISVMWNANSLDQEWTRVAVSSFNKDNHITTCTLFKDKHKVRSMALWASDTGAGIGEL